MTWRHRKIEGDHPYVFLDGIVMKRSWAGEVRNVSLLGGHWRDHADGYREILGHHARGAKEDKSGWSAFLRHLVDRGLSGVQLVVSDACRGLVESVDQFLPDAQWQRCVVHFYRNVFSHVPAAKVREVSHMLKAIHAQETRATAEAKASAVVDELRRQRMGRAAELVDAHVAETLTYYAFPDCHWIKIRTNNPLENLRPTSPSRSINNASMCIWISSSSGRISILPSAISASIDCNSETSCWHSSSVISCWSCSIRACAWEARMSCRKRRTSNRMLSVNASIFGSACWLNTPLRDGLFKIITRIKACRGLSPPA